MCHAEGRLLQNLGVNVISILIGQGLNLTEVTAITSQPTSKYLLRFGSFARLNDINEVNLLVRLVREVGATAATMTTEQTVTSQRTSEGLFPVYHSLTGT